MRNSFPEMLRYLRKTKGYSQEELAKRLGISRSSLANYEQGRREPSFEVEENIADFFNVDINTLRGVSTPDFNVNDQEFLNDYKQLNPHMIEMLKLYTKTLLDLQKKLEDSGTREDMTKWLLNTPTMKNVKSGIPSSTMEDTTRTEANTESA